MAEDGRRVWQTVGGGEPGVVETLERPSEFNLSEEIRLALVRMSTSTINRFLSEEK